MLSQRRGAVGHRMIWRARRWQRRSWWEWWEWLPGEAGHDQSMQSLHRGGQMRLLSDVDGLAFVVVGMAAGERVVGARKR